MKLNHRLYSTFDVYEAAKYLLHEAVLYNNVRLMAVTVYGLRERDPEQMTIFDSPDFLNKAALHVQDSLSDYKKWSAQRRVSDAMDVVIIAMENL